MFLGLLPATLTATQQPPAPPPAAATKQAPGAENGLTEQQELQKAIDTAGNDRAAMTHNLEEFLQKYPNSSQRPQIYRALVESNLKLDDLPKATDYAERLVALRPDDASISILAIQLLERSTDPAGWRRAVSYCTRVYEQVKSLSPNDKSPRQSQEEWEYDKKRDEASVLMARGMLYQKLNDLTAARKDYEDSYALVPGAAPATKLGDLAELRKDPNTAILEYARAFALADDSNKPSGRPELRKQLGNAWRLAHGGSEDGLGNYLLTVFDQVNAARSPAKTVRNAGLKHAYEFTLRKAPEGTAVPFSENKGKVTVLTFWATWCGPCHAMEPHFEKLAARYATDKTVVFYRLNCDDDESLVAPYLEEDKAKTPALYADGLEQLFRVGSFPTTIILDREGKVAYRTDGFDPETIDQTLNDALTRILQSPTAEPPSGDAPKPTR